MPVRSAAHAAFGAAIRQVRTEMGISQEALAGRCDLDRAVAFSGIERGERNPSLTNILKIAVGLTHSRRNSWSARGASKDRIPRP